MTRKIWLVLLFLATTQTAQARWADPSEAAYKINFERWHYKVHKDGSATITVESELEVLKDSARESEGLRRFRYDSSISTMKILEAKTINADGAIEVPKLDKEDKPLASSGPGFDVINQVTVAFPRVNVGSKLFLKTEETQRRAVIPDYFFTLQQMGRSVYDKLTLDFESERPIYLKIADPEKVLFTKADKKHIHIELKAPFYRNAVEEPNQFFTPTAQPWYAVSTAKDWTEFPKATLQAYENEITGALPASYEKIKNDARKINEPTAQINAVTSRIAELIRYNGEWRALEGLWHPRSLQTITETGFGDCKDFATSTAAILRRLGYDSHVAWTMRWREFTPTPLDDQALDVNHAIVYAVKDNHEYWIDPTNLTSSAQAIYADIANRTAYVLEASELAVKHTPAMDPSQGDMIIKTKLAFQTDELAADGTVTFKGRTAEAWTGEELKQDKKSINYNLISWVTDRSKAVGWSIGTYDLTSRIVKDLAIPFDYTVRNDAIVQTTAGKGYVISAPFFLDHFRINAKDRETDLLLANPQQLHREIEITGKDVQQLKPMECHGDSPWIAFKRELKKESNGVMMNEEMIVKTLHIPAQDIRTEKFAQLQKDILECMQEAIVVFK